MAIQTPQTTPNTAYGLSQPIINVFPKPIIALRDPVGTDRAPLGTLWVRPATNGAFVLTSVVNNVATWESITGGAGVFTSLTVNPGPISLTGTTTINTAGAATTTIGTGGTGAVNIGNATGETSVTGDLNLVNNLTLPDTNAAGTVGEIIFGANRWISNTGTRNTFVGQNSGSTTLTVVTAVDNTCVGANAGNVLTTGHNCVYVGSGSGELATTSIGNVAVGFNALSTITANGDCVAIGNGALVNATGANNIAIGSISGSVYTNEQDNILIGHQGVAADANVMRLGTTGVGAGQVNSTFIAGVFGSTVGGTGIAAVVDAAGQFGTIVSSRRFKENIDDMGDYSTDIYKLRPVTFTMKKDGSFASGFIAEEVMGVMPDLVVNDVDGQPLTVKYNDLPALLVNELQKLNARVKYLESNCHCK